MRTIKEFQRAYNSRRILWRWVSVPASDRTKIVDAIGAGGMGEVYRAIDLKLKRQVANKVLPASVTADGERLARFRRKAEILAALNHPNIAAVYGLEDSDATKALVMELVEGPTLADRRRAGSHLMCGRSVRHARRRQRVAP
jgi:serine/threonine protein kinase